MDRGRAAVVAAYWVKPAVIVLGNGQRRSKLLQQLSGGTPWPLAGVPGSEAARVHLADGPGRVQQEGLTQVETEGGRLPGHGRGVGAAQALHHARQLEAREDLPHGVGLRAPRVAQMAARRFCGSPWVGASSASSQPFGQPHDDPFVGLVKVEFVLRR